MEATFKSVEIYCDKITLRVINLCPSSSLSLSLSFSQVRLVVIDSIASPFRHGFEDMALRNRILSGLAQNLIKLATQNNIAVSSKFMHRSP